jgi:hypothetical protein
MTELLKKGVKFEWS